MSVSNPTFWVIDVGDPQKFTHKRKDTGVEFTVERVPLTLMASVDSGLDTGVTYTLWSESKKVAQKSQLWIDNSNDTRVGLFNEVSSLGFGELKVNKWKDKESNEDRSKLVQTVFLQKDSQPEWNVAELPLSRHDGNIDSIPDPVVSENVVLEEDPF